MAIMRLFLLAILIICTGTPLLAQTINKKDSINHLKGSEVIITGFPAEEGKSPVPVAEIRREELRENAPFKELPNLLKSLPSVVSYSESGLDVGYTYINIRGFDSRRESMMVNGVPQNDPEDHSVYWVDIPDLGSYASNVEMQRGAGSAFYGPPAIGGSINVETFPDPTRELTLSAMGGSYGTTKFAVNANSGLMDGKYIFSARLSQAHTDGYRDKAFFDSKTYYLSAARIDDRSMLQFNFYGGPINDGLGYYGFGAYGVFPGPNADKSGLQDPVLRKYNPSEPLTYERRPQEQEAFSQPHYEMLSSIKLDNSLTLNNTLFYIQGDGYFDFDGTWPYGSHSDIYHLTPVYGLRYGFQGITDSSLGNELTRAFVQGKQYGWLPRLEFSHEGGMFTLGAEVRVYRSTHWGQLLSAEKMPVNLPGDYHYYDYHGGKDIYSGYISERYDLSSGISLSASVQLLNQTYHFFDEQPIYYDTVTAAAEGLTPGFHSHTFDVPLFFVNPRAGLNLNFTKSFSGFFSVSYTTREPRLLDYYNAEALSIPNFNKNPDSSFNYNSPKIKPEHLLDLELGVRQSEVPLDDDWKATGGFTAYYMPFSDELIESDKTDLFGNAVLANAESVLHYGLELEGGIQFSDVLALKVNATVSHNEIRKFSADTSNVVGKTPIGFPSFIANASLLIQPIKDLKLTASMRSVGAMYGDIQNSDTFHNDAYTVLDANLSYRFDRLFGSDHITLRVQVNNLLDKLYTSYVTAGIGFFVAAPRNGYLNLEVGL
ncbi:MAG TPA: TonB-dependent receptor [Candidatus Kapabacteria bacterium]|nr:TonB-dependent receptor [Candidatus Kapabacteria bacterium]